MKELETFRKFLTEDKFEDETKELQALLNLVKHNDEAEAMVGEGSFFSVDPAPAVNQTQEAIRDEEDEDYMEALEVITNAVKQLGGTVSYIDENGLSLNYYVDENNDLITQVRSTFEIPKDELEEGEEIKEEDYMDISEPGNPLYDLNNNEEDVATLNGLIKKYTKDGYPPGLTILQLWITSGEYPQDY